MNEALNKSRKIEMDVEELKKQAKVFRTRLKMLVEAQLEVINADDWDGLFDEEGEEEVEGIQEETSEYANSNA